MRAFVLDILTGHLLAHGHNNLFAGRALILWDTLDINNFYFLFLLFSNFIKILFSFSHFFIFE